MDFRWLADPYVATIRSHAYSDGSVRSLCGQASLPVEFVVDDDLNRCGNCQRLVVKQISARQAETAPETKRWRELAARAVLGDSWTYEEAERLPSFMSEIQRVQAALAEAFKQGILQGSSSTRIGT